MWVDYPHFTGNLHEPGVPLALSGQQGSLFILDSEGFSEPIFQVDAAFHKFSFQPNQLQTVCQPPVYQILGAKSTILIKFLFFAQKKSKMADYK